MDAHQRRQRRVQIALDQRNVHGLVDVILIAAELERTVLRVHRLIIDPFERSAHSSSGSESDPHRADLRPCALATAQIRAARHRAVVIRYRLKNERSVDGSNDEPVDTEYGPFQLCCYEDHVNKTVHMRWSRAI